MLIICNGAYKCGSTWLYNILREIVSCEEIPESYLDKEWDNPSIHQDRLCAFLKEQEYHSRNFISKSHYHSLSARRMLRGKKGVYVFDVERDLRDVVVSAYHHWQNQSGYEGEFKTFYWWDGRWIVDRVRRYHSFWRMENCCLISYEGLKTNFEEEVKRLFTVMDVEWNDERIRAIKEKTTLEGLRKKYTGLIGQEGASKFFRKGKSGQWSDYFDEPIERDMKQVIAHGIPVASWGVRFVQRRILKRRPVLNTKVAAEA